MYPLFGNPWISILTKLRQAVIMLWTLEPNLYLHCSASDPFPAMCGCEDPAYLNSQLRTLTAVSFVLEEIYSHAEELLSKFCSVV